MCLSSTCWSFNDLLVENLRFPPSYPLKSRFGALIGVFPVTYGTVWYSRVYVPLDTL